MNSRAAATIRAARAAAAQRQANVPKPAVLGGKARARLAERDERGRMLADLAHPRNAGLAALYRLRIDIAAGLPRDALLERIDDELHRLKKVTS